MKSLNFYLSEKGIVELTKEESKMIDGGNWLILPPLIAIGAIAGAALGIFEFGKAFGNFIYHVTH